MEKPSVFRFRNRDNIGSAAAEDDLNFLETCFVDKGDLSTLLDCSDNRFLVMGRTGAGKTALLTRLHSNEGRVINIAPDKLALSYVSSSDILKNIMDLGISLDPLFKLLWRHVFAVEFLQAHFVTYPEDSRQTWVESLMEMFKGKKHARSLSYLKTWGEKFWLETDYRIKETTQKFEHELTTGIKADNKILSGESKSSGKVSNEDKSEVVHRAQHVIASIQVKELGEIIDLIGEVLKDKQKRYYIVIDKLDENWIEERFLYALIRTLIETAREFNNGVTNVKIIVALRVDLIERVYKMSGGPYFQPEKFQSLYLNITWTPQRLEELLDARINYLVRSRYSESQKVSFRDILPGAVNNRSVIQYMLERTLMRPRDLITFLNLCIDQATDEPSISEHMIKQAEVSYSRSRLSALSVEWGADYPHLREFMDILKLVPAHFALEELTATLCDEFCLNIAIHDYQPRDLLVSTAIAVAHGDQSSLDFRNTLIVLFYKIGLVSLKISPLEKPAWSYETNSPILSADLDARTRVSIHPCAWRALGIVSRHSPSEDTQ